MNAAQCKQCKYLSEQIMDDLLAKVRECQGFTMIVAMEHPTSTTYAVLICVGKEHFLAEDCGNFYRMLKLNVPEFPDLAVPRFRGIKQPRLVRDYNAVLAEWMQLAQGNCYLG